MIKKVVVIFALALLLFPVGLHAGFGVSPGQIDEDRLVPGSHFEYIIYLVQGTPEVDLPVKVEVESEEMKDWITFNDGNTFTIPAGIQQYPMKLSVDIPEDADLGVYKAFVRVNTVPEEDKVDGQVAIAIGGRVDLNMTVGNDIFEEFEILSIKLLNVKENEDPKVEVRIKNTGNVPTAPSVASFELFNKFGTVRLGFVESSDFKKVQSFSQDTQTISFPIDVRFAAGEYWGHVKIHDEDGKVIKELKTVFNVTEITLLEKILSYYWAGILAILIILVLFIYKRKSTINKRRRNKLD